MPEVNTLDAKALIESLRRYKREAVQAAIDAVQSPEVARAFIQYLDEQAGADKARGTDFSVTLTCIVLGEAGIISAIPALLRIAQFIPTRPGYSSYASTLALQRIAGPAFDAAMQWIESTPHSYRHYRVYDVLLAAADADEATRTRVSDFCFARLNEVLNVESEWEMEESPAHSPAEILVMLRDSRVVAQLEQLGHRVSVNLLEDFKEDRIPLRPEKEWRAPWQWVCRKWWMWNKDAWRDEDFENGVDNESLDDQENVDEESESVEVDEYAYDDPRAYDLLAQRFSASLEAQHLPYSPAESAEKVRRFLRTASEYSGDEFAICEVDRFKDVLCEYLPQELAAPITEFENLATVLAAFAKFMHEAGHLRFPDSVLPMLEHAKSRLPEIASNPARWGPDKTIAMRGFDAGIDMTDPAAIEQFVDGTRAKEFEEAEREARESYVAAHSPFRRQTPKIGRNDPCPCGSGKKYKKCCGK